MNKLRLLILNDNHFDSGFGGQASFIKNLHPYLDNEFKIKYLFLPQILFKQHFIPIRLIYFFWVSFHLLFRKKYAYDFILSHTPEASFATSFFNIPFIHIFHGNKNPLEKSSFWYGKYFQWVFNIFEKRIIKGAIFLYTVGEYRKDAKKFYNPITIPKEIVIKESSIKSGIVFSGRLESVKRVDLIIEIYNTLPNRIKEKHKLHIIGKGSQESRIRKIVNTYSLNDYVIFHGLVFNQRAIEIINNSALMIMASLFEGFPMAIAESLSVGTPVITTNVGDIQSIIKNGYNGYLIDLNSPIKDYVDNIIQVLNGDFETISKNSRKSSEIFNSMEIAKSFIADCYSIKDILHR